jgi:hypothetical protein
MFNRNPAGKNQYGLIREYSQPCVHVFSKANSKAAKADDESLVKALESYHREKLTNNQKISERLKREHGITMR